MKHSISLLSICVAFALAAPGSAQLEPEPPIGTRIPQQLEVFPTDRSRPIVRRFADCSVKKRYKLAREMILSVGKYYVQDEYLWVPDGQCLSAAVRGLDIGDVELRLSNGLLRFVIADALVAKDLANYDPEALAIAAPLAPLVYNPEDMTSRTKLSEEAERTAKGEIDIVLYGECVVRSAPVGSFRLLKTEINSDEEGAALNAMMPAFTGCLDQGRQFEASRTQLRGTVAFNFYRLAYAPKVSPLPAAGGTVQ